MSDEKKQRGVVDVLGQVVPALGIVVIAYLLGALTATYQTWPYEHVSRGFEALKATVHKASLGTPLATRYDSSLWRVARFEGKGVVTYDPARAWDGYTYLSSGHRQAAVLLDMEGNVVHEWARDFREIWPDADHVAHPTPPGFLHWARIRLFPNGDLIAIITSTDDTPSGYGMVKLDADSNVLWTYEGATHHDFHVNDDGTIWVWEAGFRDLAEEPLPNLSHHHHVLVDQFLVKVSAKGRELSRVSMHDVVAKSRFRDALFAEGVDDWDPLHPNHIEPAGEAFAAHHDFVEPDDLLVTFRNIDAIAVYDPQAEEIDWMARGSWLKQHDLDPMPDGTLLIFDNLGGLATPGPSRILRYDPADGSIDWSYAGSADAPFYSRIRGTQQPLPNGNVLISECQTGRVFEVTPDGDIVWDYRNPHRKNIDGRELIAVLEGAERVPKSFPTFLEDHEK